MADDKKTEETPSHSEGWELLQLVWFSTIHELDEIMTNAEQTKDRIAAAEVLLRYFIAFGQSINEPWVPEKPPYGDDDEDDDDD